MARRPQEPEKAPNHERWLLTYSDLITLLMIFFVLLYTISNVNSRKFAQLSASMSEALVGQNSGFFIGEAPGPVVIQQSESSRAKEAAQMDDTKEQIDKLIKQEGLTGKVEVSQETRGLNISLKEALLFPSASADITANAMAIVAKIGKIMKKLPNQIRVEGHTDNMPIHNATFPSNWELSTARATNVVRLFANDTGINPDNLSATGYGEFRPIVKNDTEAHRARNRRVDIIVLKKAFDIAEPDNEQNKLDTFLKVTDSPKQ